MGSKNYCNELESFLTKVFVPAGYKITKNVELDPVPENSKYEALVFSLNERNIVYRKGRVTPDRPGAFLTVWQRPPLPSNNDNKPIPLKSNELDYLFVRVAGYSNDVGNEELIKDSKGGVFIFPVSLLIEKGIVSSMKSKGKTGFRVFPSWCQDRGIVGTKVFSESGKKTQRWQLPFFLEIDEGGLINFSKLKKIIAHENVRLTSDYGTSPNILG